MWKGEGEEWTLFQTCIPAPLSTFSTTATFSPHSTEEKEGRVVSSCFLPSSCCIARTLMTPIPTWKVDIRNGRLRKRGRREYHHSELTLPLEHSHERGGKERTLGFQKKTITLCDKIYSTQTARTKNPRMFSMQNNINIKAKNSSAMKFNCMIYFLYTLFLPLSLY